VDGAVERMMEGRDDTVFAVHLPMFKSRLHTEGDDRFVYSEASNESWDSEGEKVLTDALLGSDAYFKAHGNVDLDHLTQIGRFMKPPIANPYLYEIGRPADVCRGDRSALVKTAIYRGEGPHVEMANWFWDTQTKQSPAQPFFPSICGRPLERKKFLDPITKAHRIITTRALWNNMAFAKNPINLSVPAVSIHGFDEFVKSAVLARDLPGCAEGETCAGACCGIAKAMTATPASSDMAARTGGAALARQSLTGKTRAVAASYLRGLRGERDHQCAHTTSAPSMETLTDHFAKCGGLDALGARRAARDFLTSIRDTTAAKAA